MSRFWKKHMQPYRLLVHLTWGEDDYIIREETDKGYRITLRTGPFNRSLGITTDRMKEYMEVLRKSGLIGEITYSYGKAVMEVVRPAAWAPDTWDGTIKNDNWFSSTNQPGRMQ